MKLRLSMLFLSGRQEREKDGLPDVFRAGEEEHKPVYPKPQATSGRHAMFERTDKIPVHRAGALLAVARQTFHAAELVFGIVELGEGVPELDTTGKYLEPFRDVVTILLAFGKQASRKVDGIVAEKRRLDEL